MTQENLLGEFKFKMHVQKEYEKLTGKLYVRMWYTVEEKQHGN